MQTVQNSANKRKGKQRPKQVQENMDGKDEQVKDWILRTQGTENTNQTPWLNGRLMEYSGYDSEGRGISPLIAVSEPQETKPAALLNNIPLHILQDFLLNDLHVPNLSERDQQDFRGQSPMAGSTASSVTVSRPQQPLEQGHIPCSLATDNITRPPSNSSSAASVISACGSSDHLPQYNQRVLTRKCNQLNSKGQSSSKNSSMKMKNSSPQEKEEKRKKNREYAKTSRQKKANEVIKLKEDNIQQEAIIEIYKKVLSIYHSRLNGTSIKWSEHHIKWFPSQATRNSPPVNVKCYLPEHDESFLTELGNSAYGQLCQTKPEPNASSEVEAAAAATENHGNKACISLTTGTYVRKGNENILQSDTSSVKNQSSPNSVLYSCAEQSLTPVIDERNSENLVSSEYPPTYVGDVKKETPDHQESPHMFEKKENVYLQQVNNEDILKLISEASQNQTAGSGQPLNVIYVVTQPKNLKRSCDQPLAFSVDKAEDTAVQKGMSNPKMMRMDDGNPVPNLKKEQDLNNSSSSFPYCSVTRSQMNYEVTAVLNSAQCTTSIEEIKNKRQTQSDKNVENHHGEISKLLVINKGNEMPNMHLQMSMPENKHQGISKTVESFGANSTSLSGPNCVAYNTATCVNLKDKMPGGYPVSALNENIKVIYEPQISNLSACNNNQGVCNPISSLCKFKENKTIPTTSTAPVPTVHYKSNESENVRQMKTVHSEEKFDNISPTSHELPSQLTDKATNAVNSVVGTNNRVEHVPENSNIPFLYVNPKLKATSTNSLPATSYSAQSVDTLATQGTIISQSSHVGTLLLAPPAPTVPGNNPLPMMSKDLTQNSNAVLKTPVSPDGGQYFLQILNSNSTSGLSSLSSYVMENDHVELENLKATFLDQT